MSKFGIVLWLFIFLLIGGCCYGVYHDYTAAEEKSNNYKRELAQFIRVYNENDINDFGTDFNQNLNKFKICQLSQFTETQKEKHMSGWFFLFVGSASSDEKGNITLNYYAYVEDIRGGIYFVTLPVERTKIYQDACPGEAYLVGDVNNFNEKLTGFNRKYYFNLHLPQGTIIPRIDAIDLEKFRK